MVRRVAMVTTHPIQYQSPWFAAIARREDVEFEVLYCHRASAAEQGEAGFGVAFEWDVPLLEGYAFRFLDNLAKRPSMRTFSGISCPSLQSIVAERRYDAVVVGGWHYRAAWQTFVACWRLGIPVSVRSDSQLAARRPLHVRAVKAFLYPWFLRRMYRCLSVGERSEQYFRHFGVEDARIAIVPHCVDVSAFAARAGAALARRGEIRRRFGLADGPVALFVGKLIDVKRPLDLLEAVRVSPPDIKVQVMFVGSGPLQHSLAEAARSLGLGERVKFAGFLNQSEIVDAYVAADLLVLPSSSESWGLVVNEAHACGLPAIVSDAVGCAPEVHQAFGSSFVYPVADVSRLATLIATLVSDGAKMDDAKRRARAEAARRTPDESAACFARLFCNLSGD